MSSSSPEVPTSVIRRSTVFCLGVSLFVGWGVSYYLIGLFGHRIAADLDWSLTFVHGGFTLALLVMAAASPIVGRLIDAYGGRQVMAGGAVLTAIGCFGVSAAAGPVTYLVSWLCLGLAMRLTLYDAAFATLARMGGRESKQAMAQVTLFGGLSSTAFWPLGDYLADLMGWRGALVVYAALALLTVPFLLAIPTQRYSAPAGDTQIDLPLANTRRQQRVAGGLYAIVFAVAHFLSAAMSAHVLVLLIGLGVAASTAVWIGTLRGIGQVTGRLGQVLFGARLSPIDLNTWAIFLLPVSFVLAFFSGAFLPAAMAFVFLYGAGHGIATITAGTLPLVLFDHRTYGGFVGRLLVPGFLASALAPLTFAFVIERYGEKAAVTLSLLLAAIALGLALVLKSYVRGSRT